jgi:hypothetical protein
MKIRGGLRVKKVRAKNAKVHAKNAVFFLKILP